MNHTILAGPTGTSNMFRPDPETLQWVHDLLREYEYPGEPAASLTRARRIIRDQADTYGIEVTA